MFTGNEIGQIQEYLTKVGAGKKVEYFNDLKKSDPEWEKVFPLFERLADYAVTRINDPQENNNYKIFKQIGSDSQAFFESMYRHATSFHKALETYIVNHRP